MITSIKIKHIEHFPIDGFTIDKITKKNIFIGKNGFGKTTLFKAIRKWVVEQNRDEISIFFSEAFMESPKHVYFTLPEELDGRAIQKDINPSDSKTFMAKTVKSMQMSEMSSGQEQRDILSMFKSDAIYDGCIWFIDEPEKSLDVVEFDKFIKYLLTSDIQVFINTHSPTLLNDNRFNRIILDADYYEKIHKIFKKVGK